MRITNLIRVALALSVIWSLTGCANFHFYSPARDDQGKAAKEAWGKVDLPTQLANSRKNQKALLDERLKLEDQLWALRRARLAELLTQKTVAQFRAMTKESAIRVAGSVQSLKDLKDAADALALAKRLYLTDTSGLLSAGRPLPSCAVLISANDASAPDHDKAVAQIAAATALIPAALSNNYSNSLRSIRNDCVALNPKPLMLGGDLGTAQAALAADEALLKPAKKTAEEVKALYDAAVKEYEDALVQYGQNADAGNDTDASRTKLDAALKKVGDALDPLKSAQDAFSVKVVSDARLDSLNRFLTTYKAIRDGKGTPENANKAAEALAVFPDLRNKAKTILAEVDKPNLVPFFLQKSVDQARADGAQRDIDVVTTRLALRQAHIDALTAQALALYGVWSALDVDALKKVYDGKQLIEVLQPLTAAESKVRDDSGPVQNKKRAWLAAALYLDEEGPLRAEAVKTEHRIVALSYEQALSLSESNINQWKALIDPSVELMASYGSSGTKSSDVTSFFNSLMLLVIAVGVN